MFLWLSIKLKALKMFGPGKGKTPLRRPGRMAAMSAMKTLAPTHEGCCEKSCQVTSEQIKADMRAATESGTNGLAGVGKQGPTAGGARDRNMTMRHAHNTAMGPGSTGGRAGTRQSASRVCTNLEREQGTVSGRNLGRTTYEAAGTAGRETRTVQSNGGRVSSSSERVGDAESRHSIRDGETGALAEPAGSGIMVSVESRGSGTTNRHCNETLTEGQRPPSESLGCSNLEPVNCLEETFVPRRPLTRSRSRMSAVPLIAEAGMFIVSKFLCKTGGRLIPLVSSAQTFNSFKTYYYCNISQCILHDNVLQL